MEMRGYVLTLAGLLLSLLAAALTVSWFGIDQCTLLDRNICGLWYYQQAKLAAAPKQIDLLLLGDSSLGNGVDAKAMAEKSGKTVLNLAVSGATLGIPAIETQLRAAVRRRTITNLVIVLSPETYRRKFTADDDGFVLANRGNPGRILALPPALAVEAADALVRFLFDNGVQADGFRYLTTGRRDLGDCAGCAARDYIAQEPDGKPTDDELRKWRGPFDDFDPFLARIARLCRDHAVNCLYMHGPIIQKALDLNPGYVAKIDAKVERAGLRLVAPDPVIIAPDEVGDSVNHVRPDLREVYSAKIYDAIAPLLK
jgi:hypothetical protein